MADLTEQDKAEFPTTLHVRLEPDRDRDILIAGTDALDALGQCDQALLGVYQLVRVIDARRSVEVREVKPAGAKPAG